MIFWMKNEKGIVYIDFLNNMLFCERHVSYKKTWFRVQPIYLTSLRKYISLADTVSDSKRSSLFRALIKTNFSIYSTFTIFLNTNNVTKVFNEKYTFAHLNLLICQNFIWASPAHEQYQFSYFILSTSSAISFNKKHY